MTYYHPPDYFLLHFLHAGIVSIWSSSMTWHKQYLFVQRMVRFDIFLFAQAMTMEFRTGFFAAPIRPQVGGPWRNLGMGNDHVIVSCFQRAFDRKPVLIVVDANGEGWIWTALLPNFRWRGIGMYPSTKETYKAGEKWRGDFFDMCRVLGLFCWSWQWVAVLEWCCQEMMSPYFLRNKGPRWRIGCRRNRR